MTTKFSSFILAMNGPNSTVMDLWFGSNNLNQIKSDTFKDWKNYLEKNIRSLYLQYNNIKYIEPEAFDKLQDWIHFFRKKSKI